MILAKYSPELLLAAGVVGGLSFAFVMGALAYSVVGFVRRRGWFGLRCNRTCAQEGLAEFASKVRMLEQKQRVLNAYAAEYFNTLQGAGWEEVVSLIDNLRSVEGSLQIMFEQKKYREVLEVCDYLMQRLSAEEALAVEAAYEGLQQLAHWRQQSRELFLRVIQATTVSAEQTQELGIKRSQRNRKPTLLSLSDIRSALGDL
jgi:hypothetical protein